MDAYVVTPAGQRTTNPADYERAGRLWEAAYSGVWGGDFPGFGAGGDAGHFEYHPGLKIAEVCPDPSRCEQSVAKWGRSKRPTSVIGLAGLGVVLGTIGATLLWRRQQ